MPAGRLGPNPVKSDEQWKGNTKHECNKRSTFQLPVAARVVSRDRGTAITKTKLDALNNELSNTASTSAGKLTGHWATRTMKSSNEYEHWGAAEASWKPAQPPSAASTATSVEDWRFKGAPNPGDKVLMIGSTSRTELNGRVGEVLTNCTDKKGFLTVSFSPGHGESNDAECRRMKVHPSRLVLAQSASSPALQATGGRLAAPNLKTTLSWGFPRSSPGNLLVGRDKRYSGRAESVWTTESKSAVSSHNPRHVDGTLLMDHVAGTPLLWSAHS